MVTQFPENWDMSLKGAIFDWDGTLASIDEREFYCINHALREEGANTIDREFYVNNYYRRAYELGTGPRMVLETALTDRPTVVVEKAYESYRKHFQSSADKAILQRGAIEILTALKQARFKIGVATMRFTRWVVESELKLLGVTPFLDLLKTRQDLGVSGRLGSLEETVNQRIQLVTGELTELKLDIGDAFLVGDSWWDIRAGRQIGIKTALVKTGFAAYNDFSSEGPDLTVSSLSELRETLEKRGWMSLPR
jgi:phosphoglycolate phosphatase-like HAD superfamily hydrolase